MHFCRKLFPYRLLEYLLYAWYVLGIGTEKERIVSVNKDFTAQWGNLSLTLIIVMMMIPGKYLSLVFYYNT